MSEPAFDFGGEIVWRPTPEIIAQSRLKQFMDQHGLATFDELLQHSTADLEWFWDAVLKFLDIQFYLPYSQVVDLSNGPEWPVWCAGGVMNIVHNCLDKRIGTADEHKAALIYESEDGRTRTYTYAQLYREVNKTANALRSLGLGRGDAIGLFMPMVPEIVIALLAIAKIGGISLPLFSGYGEAAIASRLIDAEAKALFTADGFYRRGQIVPMKSIADEAARQVPTLQQMLVLNRVGAGAPMQDGRDHWWHALIDWQSDRAPTEP